MTRTHHFLLTALGAAVALLLGSGLLAISSDVAGSDGNQAMSGDYVPPSHDVKIALGNTAVGCDQVEYGDSAGPIYTLAFGAPNVAMRRGEPVAHSSILCVRNAGATAGTLTLLFANAIETETACSEGEGPNPEDPIFDGPDEGCGGDNMGELSSVLEATVRGAVPGEVCSGLGPMSFLELGSPVHEVGQLEPGAVCSFDITLSVAPDATDDELFAAQSDLLEWTIAGILSDPVS